MLNAVESHCKGHVLHQLVTDQPNHTLAAPAALCHVLMFRRFCRKSENGVAIQLVLKANIILSATSCVVDEFDLGALGEFVAQYYVIVL